MKMEIKKYTTNKQLNPNGSNTILFDATTTNASTTSLSDFLLEDDCDLFVEKVVSNIIYLGKLNESDSFYEIHLSPQDIRNLMKWQLGQDEYNENQRKHEDKILTKDEENQKIVDKVTQLYDQEDFGDVDEAITYLHFRGKLAKALGKNPAEE